jgi:hypothetical protein
MKNLKLAFIFLFVLGTSVTALSQNEGMESFASVFASLNIDSLKEHMHDSYYDQPEFRGKGKFLDAIKDPVLWKKLITQKDGNYIGVFAPGVEWDLYTEDNIVYHPIFIKSTVDSYYDNTLKNMEYDRYEYEVLTQDDGTVQEYYTLFKNGEFYKSYGVCGHYNKITSISEYNEQ